MPQSTILYETAKNNAQVIALDPRVVDQPSSEDKHFRILQLSDLLSRNLEIEHIIENFIHEIKAEIPHSGYRFKSSDTSQEVSSGKTVGCCASYRLRIQDHQLGEISLFRETIFNSSELCRLEELLCALIYPVRNASMYHIALQSAYRDPLTGLNNRAAMEKLLPREIELANRHDRPMAVLVMDLDGFKQINDRYGHDTGDQVLRDVGQVLQEAVRNTDLLYRYGGDEFVGGLAQTDMKGAFEVSERIRSGVETLTISGREISSKIEVSIGITMLRPGDSFAHAFKRADKALYQAKQGGKNCIMSA